MKKRKIDTTILLVGIFCLALTLRIIYYFDVHNQLYFQALIFDAKYYDNWARNILNEGWIGKGIFFVSPLYAYFLAVIYKLGGNPTTVKIIQFALGSISPLLIYGIGLRLFDRKTAICASLLSCFYKGYVLFEGLLLKTAIEVFLTTLTFLFLVLAKDKKNAWMWFISGITLGLSVLAKDTSIIFIPLVIAWIYFLKGRIRHSINPSLAFLLGSLIIVGPLTLRNVVVGKDFVLTTYAGGINFYQGNCKGADGGLKAPDFERIDPEYEEIDSKVEAERRAGRQLKASEISAFWTKEALEEIKQNPKHSISLLLRKTALLINRTGLSDNYQITLFKQYSFFFKYLLIGFWPIAVFGLSGIALCFFFSKKLKEQSILLFFFFSTSFVLILTHIIDRYREVLIPVIILFASYFIIEIVQNIRQRNLNFLAAAVGIMASFTLLTSLHLPNFEQKPEADAHNQLGLLYYEKQDYINAFKQYKKALDARPEHLWARQNLAKVYLIMGNVDDAISEYKKALRFRPDDMRLYMLLKDATSLKGLPKEEILKRIKENENKTQFPSIAPPSASYYLGLEYLMNKQYRKAIGQFEEILKSSPEDLNSLINLGVAYRKSGQQQKAIEVYEKALSIEPTLLPAHYNLSMVLMSQGKFEKAIPHLKDIIVIFPEYLFAQYYLARAYEETNQIKKATNEYKSFIDRIKDDPEKQKMVIQIRNKISSLEKAFKE